MNRQLCTKVFLLLSLFFLFTLYSCKKEDEGDFKKGRLTFMSNDVTMRIVCPVQQDTIIYKDSTSGFTMNIENNHLMTREFSFNDTITFHKEKKDMRLTLKFDNFYYKNSEQAFGFGGNGVLYLKPRGNSVWQDTVPLIVYSVSGNIEGNKMTFSIFKEPDKSFTDPYVALYYIGSRIY